MTQQYQPNSINNPRLARTVTVATLATLDDTLIVADSTAAPFAVTLPNAAQIPGNVVTIKAPVGNTNNVTVNTVLAQTIDGAATFVMTAAEQSLVVQSDGANWQIALPTALPQSQVISNVVLVADDGAAAILNTTGSIQLAGSTALAKAIATTSSYAGQKVNLFLLAFAGGSYTLVLDVGTLTFNAASEGAVVQRNTANTAWVCVGLSGATIV